MLTANSPFGSLTLILSPLVANPCPASPLIHCARSAAELSYVAPSHSLDCTMPCWKTRSWSDSHPCQKMFLASQSLKSTALAWTVPVWAVQVRAEMVPGQQAACTHCAWWRHLPLPSPAPPAPARTAASTARTLIVQPLQLGKHSTAAVSVLIPPTAPAPHHLRTRRGNWPLSAKRSPRRPSMTACVNNGPSSSASWIPSVP